MRAMCRVARTEVRYSKFIILLAALVLMCGIFVSCGSEDVIPAVVSVDLTNASPLPSPLVGEGQGEGDYTGKVVVKFKDGTNVRLSSRDSSSLDGLGTQNDMQFITTRRDSPREAYEVRRVNEVVSSAPLTPALSLKGRGGTARVTDIRRVMEEQEEVVEQWQRRLRDEGQTIKDWNLYYYLDVPEYDDAVELVKELNGLAPSPRPSPSRGEGEGGGDSVIEYAEVIPIFQLAEVLGPDMSGEQGYLKSASTGGLGIEDAWAQGIYGQSTMVIDQEYDWNFDHEILPIDETGEYIHNPLQIGKDVPNNIEHGTAVVGIIAGQGNDISKGIKGIVPQTAMRIASIELGAGSMGVGYLPPIAEQEVMYSNLLVGSVYTIEVQRKGITTTGTCNVGDGVNSPIVTGCVPIEASKFVFDIIQLGVSMGKVIVEGVGNGGVNLNDNNTAKPKDGEFSDFNNNDSGAIMVGASLGADKKKAAWSNCGDRVDVFAWGAGVVTAGYGDKFCVEGAGGKPCTDPDNPTKYTGQFGGTSAATAQIAGVAALVQSYFRKLIDDAGYVGKTFFLDSKQMRTILKNSGQSAVYGQTPNDPNPSCNIGVQPDAVQALNVAKDFVKQNVLKVVPLNKDAMSGPKGINYDMDGDGRADLISFSRDNKWYIDLSSVQPPGGSPDGYGAWDLILVSPSFEPNAMLFPVVNDYSPDGQYTSKRLADLSVYDAVNGKWYIKYTDNSLIQSLSKDEQPMEWGKVIDYSNDLMWRPYSRPVPGNYDGDGFLDTALQTPDGYWLIDYGGSECVKIQLADGGWLKASPSGQWTAECESGQWSQVSENVYATDHFGSFEKDVKYLTDDQLAQAPGWAWLPVAGDAPWGMYATSMIAKSPDGILDWNNLVQGTPPDFDDIADSIYFAPHVYGDNSNYLVVGALQNAGGSELAIKNPEGDWLIFSDGALGGKGMPPISLPPDGIYGDILCRPAPADYDGDGKDERDVQCGTTWVIAYSTDEDAFRTVELDQALDPVPAYVYAGGIKYQDQIDLFNYYKTKLPCQNGQKCLASDTIFNVVPPIGPYFAECVKYWAPNASYCWSK